MLSCELIRKLKNSITRNPAHASGAVGSFTGKNSMAIAIPGIMNSINRNSPSPKPCIILTIR
ncbi:hypothetical protein D1872_339250 [compost metagenome]